MNKAITSTIISKLESATIRISGLYGIILLLTYASSGMAAVTVTSSGFNGVTDGAITTTGLLDWGYVSANGFFDSNASNELFGDILDGSTNVTTVSTTSSIGEVRFSESGTSNDSGNGPFTFDGSTSAGRNSSFAPNEQDIFTITFNDLGVGSGIISLYLGHTQNDRVFDMDVSGTGFSAFTDTSPQIGTLGSTVAFGSGSAITYDIAYTATSASDDLTLTFGSVSGDFGNGLFSGYTVTAIPEPSTFALVAISLVALIGFRRRGK